MSPYNSDLMTVACCSMELLVIITGRLGKGILWRPFTKIIRAGNIDDPLGMVMTLTARVLVCSPFAFWSENISNWLFIVLFVDDYLAGRDGNNWRRRWKTANNKIKWRMKIVVPKPVVQ